MRLPTIAVLTLGALAAPLAASQKRRLVAEQDSSLVQSAADDIIAKVRTSATVVNSRSPEDLADEMCPALRSDVRYTSSKMEYMYGIDLASCCVSCALFRDCHRFTFYAHQSDVRGACELMAGAVNETATTEKVYSGIMPSPKPTSVPVPTPPQPTPAPPATCPPLQYYRSSAGNLLRPEINVNDLAECCDACNADTNCISFTFSEYAVLNSGRPGCYLYASLPTYHKFDFFSVAGIKGARPTPPTPAPSPVLTTTGQPTTLPPPLPPGPTPPTAQPTPVPTVPPTPVPAPTTSAPPAAAPTTTPTPTTPKPTPTPTTTPPTPAPTLPASCPLIEVNTDYAGNDLHRIPNLDQAACCAACNAEILCKVFTFVPDSASSAFGACYLKSAAGARKTAVGAYSGVKTLSVCPVTEIGIDYYGNDLEAVQEVDQSECCAKCNADTRCNAFTFVPYGSPSTKGACYLKSAAAGRIPTAGAISGTKTTNVCPRMEVDIDYSGNDIRSVTGVDQAGCCVQCNAEPKCKAFTYVPDARSPTTGVCYLKSSGAGRTWASGMHSGIKGQL